MIDTLILRIHDTDKYANLIDNLDKLNSKGYQTESLKVDKAEIAKLRGKGIRDSKEILDILKMNHKGEYLIKTKYAKHMNASSHYSLAYQVNYTANYVEFNFSVPKYTYGSNVLMFAEHFFDRGYQVGLCATLEYNMERAYDRLLRFIDQLFRMEFPHSTIDYRDVEVNRIDVCFNQVFPSKREALLYLEYQKRLKKKYAREEEGTMREYATSIMYVTKRYSAKIYHKGTEYSKNDLKEHLKINKDRGYEHFKTRHYQAFADRILRYEVTLRTNMLNYLHKAHLFRRKCPFYPSYYKTYMVVQNKKQKNDRIAGKIGTLEGEAKAQYQREHPYEKIEKEDRRVHKYVSHLITKRTLFMLAIEESDKVYNKQTVNYNSDRALFSKGLLKLCLSKLVEFMGEFGIKELPEEEKVRKLIESYNLSHRKPLPISEMVWFYQKLMEVGSFKETAKLYNLHKATLYRYKERFKKIGISENNLLPATETSLPHAPLDLSVYHSVVTYNPHFLTHNNLMS